MGVGVRGLGTGDAVYVWVLDILFISYSSTVLTRVGLCAFLSPLSSQLLAHHLPATPFHQRYIYKFRSHTVTASSQLKSGTGLAQRYWEEDRLDTNRKRTGSTPPRGAKP